MARKIGKAYSLSQARGDTYSTGAPRRRGPYYVDATLTPSDRGDGADDDWSEDWNTDWGERDDLGLFQGRARNTRLITIEAREHMHLLALYYAAYDDMNTPSAATEDAYIQALERCNDFYAGDVAWY